MKTNPIIAEITIARAALHGDYVSVSRVADTLLDIRTMAAGSPELVELVDETLASMPGRSVVPNTWWSDALDAIEALGAGVETPVEAVTG